MLLPQSRAIQRTDTSSGRTSSGGPTVSVGSAMARAGGQLQHAGEVAGNIQLRDLEAEATAQAKERDVEASNRIRSLLYDTETGFANLSGRNAVERREGILKEIDGLSAELSQGLPPAAKRKLDSSLRRRVESAYNSVDRHAAAEKTIWQNGAATARIESAYQDALFDPLETQAALTIIKGEIADGAQRNGWDPAKTELELAKATSKLYADQIVQTATTDPIGSMEYLQQNKENMLPADYAKMERMLSPAVKEHKGRQLAASALGGTPSYDHDTKIDFAMGPARPYAPNKPVLDVIGKSAQDIFGKGARVVVTSGQEGDKHQHGSNRHKTGNAADVQVIRPDGSVVKATDPDMAKFAKAAAQNGALGIGFGAEYMGGTHVHVDLVSPGNGQAHTWASGGKAMRGEITSIIQGRSNGGGIEAILAESDPDVQKAALYQYNLQVKARDAQDKAIKQQASNALYEWIEKGGDIADMPVEQRVNLSGDILDEARKYQATKTANEKIDTDTELYVELSQMAASDPQAFLAQDPLMWRNNLDDGDFTKFTDLQRKMAEGEKAPAVTTMLSEADARLLAAGITKTDRPDDYAKFQSDLIRWADENPDLAGNARARDEQVKDMLLSVVRTPKTPPKQTTLMSTADAALRSINVTKTKKPEEYRAFENSITQWAAANPDLAANEVALNAQIDRMTAEVVLDPSGFTGTNVRQSGYAYELDFNGITPEDFLGATVKINGSRVPVEDIEQLAGRFIELVGRDPTPQEMMTALISSGKY